MHLLIHTSITVNFTCVSSTNIVKICVQGVETIQEMGKSLKRRFWGPGIPLLEFWVILRQSWVDQKARYRFQAYSSLKCSFISISTFV